MNPINHFVEMLVPMIATFGFFLLVAWIVWVVNKSRRERVLRTIELQNRMLEKFTSSEEFASFIKTPEGQRYFREMTAEPRKNPRTKIMNSIRTGVVLVVLGTGLIAISFLVGFDRPMEEGPFIIGFIGLFLGLGFLASAGVSYAMSKAWGLFPEDSNTVSRSEKP